MKVIKNVVSVFSNDLINCFVHVIVEILYTKCCDLPVTTINIFVCERRVRESFVDFKEK